MSNSQLRFEGSESQRIDTRLTSQLPYSRSFFHHLFERKAITVGKWEWRPVKKSYKIKPGETVTIASIDRFLDWWILEEAPALDLTILKEDTDYVVIYKPKGVLSHPNSVWDVEHPNVVWALYHHFKASGTLPSSASFIRAGLIHRLDKETDWVMIIAKTEEWLAHFKNLFQQKSEATTRQEKEEVPLTKQYEALCYATDQGESFLGTHTAPFYIESLVSPKTPFPVPKIGISKVLWWTQEEVNGKKAYRMSIEILTWRTHQIRIHMSENWLPIVGDYLYWTEEEWTSMQLSAVRMKFIDLKGNNITVKKP